VERTFSSAFFANEPSARAFLPRDFRDGAARLAAARDAAGRRVSPAVLEVLREQQAALPASAARDANLKALARGETAVVVTGQQVGLFLGPLYSLYKAASAIAVARALTAESGVRCVPLFWLQTEDHDYAEIASCHVQGADGAPVTLSLPPEPAAEARVSIAHRRLGPEVSSLVDRLAEALGEGPAAAEVVAIVRAHYQPGRPLAAAFAGVLATIFAEDGLLIFDPREARVAAAAAPLYRRALDEAGAVEAALHARGEALAAAGFGQQIPVREGCALLFFHEGDARGPRYRLKRARDRWELAGLANTVEDAEIRRALGAEPLRFSTSAQLRPLVQDTLLPTAAYVGGPAEVSYFAQLGPVYDHLRVPQPLVVPRARFRVVDAPTRRRLDALGLAAADAERPRGELVARLAASRSGATSAGQPTPDALRARAAGIAPAVDEIARALLAVDGGASRAVTRSRGSIDHALGRLLARYEHALAARDATALARLDKVVAALAPEGVPQERVYAWPSLAARLGGAALRRLVLDRLAADAFPVAVQELTP
jgi:bacillithiol biosynthesis cysteine-adding enzyme BshC